MKGRYVIAGIAMSALLTFAADKIATNLKEKEMAPLKNYTKTIEYKVQKGDCFQKLAEQFIPYEIRSQYGGSYVPGQYLKEINKGTSDFLQLGENIKIPVYGK